MGMRCYGGGSRSPRQKYDAKSILEAAGVGEAFPLFEGLKGKLNKSWAEATLFDIVLKAELYGPLSEKQVNFLKSLVEKVKDAPAVEAKRAAEKAAADDVPEGRFPEGQGHPVRQEVRLLLPALREDPEEGFPRGGR